ncbi:MAG: General secretory pathway protein E [Candidatus Saccharibacteria bacterium GW2011_GWA2_46_10]|nr:MAG: General secretory pathway protein E [Candidatus Saccharibacteria bacterium GW2011_GWA2_46_10]
MPLTDKQIGEILLKQSYISKEELAKAEERSEKLKAPLVGVLMDQGILTQQLFDEALAEHFELEFYDVRQNPPPAQTIMLLPEEVARAYSAVVVKKEGNTVTVATSEPGSETLEEAVRLNLERAEGVMPEAKESSSFAKASPFAKATGDKSEDKKEAKELSQQHPSSGAEYPPARPKSAAADVGGSSPAAKKKTKSNKFTFSFGKKKKEEKPEHVKFAGEVKFVYAPRASIESVFKHYQKPLATRFQQIISEEGKVAPEILVEILNDAIGLRASDIHFEPQEKTVVVRFRVDGVMHEAGRIPKEHYEGVLNRIKIDGNMRIDEHYAAQDGAIRHRPSLFELRPASQTSLSELRPASQTSPSELRLASQTSLSELRPASQTPSDQIDIRVSIVPIVDGEKVVMRILAEYVRNLTLSDLGFTQKNQEILIKAANKPFGMILTTGPTGSGKSTTLYALVKMRNAPDVNISTIEDPVEYKIAGINHIQVNTKTNLTFASGLRALVRQDPNIILVGEIRDGETADIAVNAALTGHLLFSTLHANDAATAVPRLLDMGVEPFLLASTLEVVIGQRLVRRICPQCRYSFTVVKSEADKMFPGAEKFFSEGDATLYKGKGCESCGGTGYRGRIGIYELLEITREIEDLIIKRASSSEINACARKNGMKLMFEDGFEKVLTGMTTIEELIRVAAPPEVVLSESKEK